MGDDSHMIEDAWATRPAPEDPFVIRTALSGVADTDVDFLKKNAETDRVDRPVDITLHLGTLYHLPNPIRALQTTLENLVPGGWLALETHSYNNADDPSLCAWIRGRN